MDVIFGNYIQPLLCIIILFGSFLMLNPMLTILNGEISYYIRKSNLTKEYVDIQVISSSLRWENFDIEFEYRNNVEEDWKHDASITFTSANSVVDNRIYGLSCPKYGETNLVRWNFANNGLSYGKSLQIRIKILPRIRNFGLSILNNSISETYGINGADIITSNKQCIGLNKNGQYICLTYNSVSIFENLSYSIPVNEFLDVLNPVHSIQIDNGNYIVCDSGNDRVLELSEDLSSILNAYSIISPTFADYDNINSLCLITSSLSNSIVEVSLDYNSLIWISTASLLNPQSATYSFNNGDEIIISDFGNNRVIVESKTIGIEKIINNYKISHDGNQNYAFYHPYRSYKFNDGGILVIEKDGKIVDFNYVPELMSSSSSSSSSIIINSTSSISSQSSSSSILINSTSSVSSRSSFSSQSSILINSTSSVSSSSSSSSYSSFSSNSSSSIIKHSTSSNSSSIKIKSTSSNSLSTSSSYSSSSTSSSTSSSSSSSTSSSSTSSESSSIIKYSTSSSIVKYSTSSNSSTSSIPYYLYACGNNSDGGIGDGTIIPKSYPVRIGSDTNWSVVNSGFSSFGINSGKLYVWGDNTYGQLGTGNLNPLSSPVQLGSGTNWSMISSKGMHTIGKRSVLYAWGENAYGELGDGTIVKRSSPVQIGGASNWTSIITSNVSSAGIHNGSLYLWGYNSDGRLGLGDTNHRSSPTQIGSESDWTSIGASGAAFFGIRSGKLYSWGINVDGQLGLGDLTSRYSPVQVGTDSDWTTISGGDSHVLGIKSGKLYGWGGNAYGYLGLGDTDSRSSPVQIGSYSDWTTISAGEYTSAGIRSKMLYSWGRNDVGQLGLGDTIDRSSPVQIGSGNKWTSVDCGEELMLAIL